VRTVVVIAAALTAAACSSKSESRELEDYGKLPAFALTDHRGQPVTDKAFDGQITIANFVFTRCQTVCPVVTLRMKGFQQKTRGDGLQLMSFSVDPAYDTPERLAAYAAKADAEPRWRFVTGDPADVAPLLRDGFKVPMDLAGTTDAGTPNVIHSSHFVLIDRRGHLRGFYDSSDPDRMDALLADARALLRGRS
jgi:protein SCO1/2